VIVVETVTLVKLVEIELITEVVVLMKVSIRVLYRKTQIYSRKDGSV
jgi:hypothetical protein